MLFAWLSQYSKLKQGEISEDEYDNWRYNTNAGKSSEDGVWFGTSEPDDSKRRIVTVIQ